MSGKKTGAMSEENGGTSALVPRLRFPEFRKTGEWSGKSLASVLIEHGQMDNGNCQVHSVSVHKGVVNQKEHLGRSFAAADTSNYNLVRPHDVVYTKSPTGDFPYGVVKQNKNDFDVIVSPLYGVFSPINKHVGTLIDCYFESPSRAKWFLEPIVQKGAKNTVQISNEVFLSRGIPLPIEPKEQQKIADCLSSLDELITVESQKLGALKAHKKGLMQQLFPREGETVPRLRFPEFREAGEWDVKPLSALADNLDNRRIPVTESDRIKGSIPYYGASGIVDYIHDFIFDEALLCISEDGANLVARTTPIAFSISGKTWVNNHAHVLKFERRCVQKIVEDYLNSISLEDYLTGMAQPKLNRAMLDTIPVPAPQDDGEQQAVADCLSSLHDLITTQSQKIDALKTHKKGLMQQLFPVLDEVPA